MTARRADATDAALAWLQRHRQKPGDARPPIYRADMVARSASVLLVMAALLDRGGPVTWSVAEIATYTGLSDSATRARLDWLARRGPYRGHPRELAVVHYSRLFGYGLDVQALWDNAR